MMGTKERPPLGDRLLYSMEEAAQKLSLSRRFFYDLVLTKQIPSTKLGRRRLVSHRDLEAFVDSQVQAS
jgi:excisionase family DNA binding protein